MKILALSLAALATAFSSVALCATMEPEKEGPVSYYEEIRPLFQAKCHGCHQPAKAKGDYVMTDHTRLLTGGEEGEAIQPGKPALSYLIEMIVPVDGKAEMPKKDDAFKQDEIALIRKWIAEGAIDDTPANAVQRYDDEHPPVYTRAPIVTALDYSPDGKLLAVAGFNEVLLHNANGSGVAARLIGLSERIESVAFSPDGKKLAVTGGLPGRMGEVQVWDVAKRELALSVPVTYDTLYGASWSPDGKLIAFGCADNSVRAIDASTGKPVLYQGAHNDWVLDTDFSTDGKHLMSVGRDMAAKLIEVETERFVDNITSITPGALKGGIATIARHPTRNEILVGGSDGIPQTYRLFRETARKIGDNANLLRRFPAMEGRVWSAAWRPDGKQIAAGSSYNGKGALNIYASEYEMDFPKEVAAVYSKAARLVRSEAEQKTLDDFHTEGAKLNHSIALDTAIYAVTFSPDGKTVAAAGEDGLIRLVDAKSGKIRKEFNPVTLDDSASHLTSTSTKGKAPINHARGKAAADLEETLPKDRVTSIEILPGSIRLTGRTQYNQLLATARLAGGGTADVTRLVEWSLDKPLLNIAERGLARPVAEGKATLTATLGKKKAAAPVHVTGLDVAFQPNFVRDVNPVITRLGCNAGACHGAKDGKNGFKLSLRGYDPLYDVRAFADDHSARRINFASADNSLMLLKATGAVPHEGQQVTGLNSEYYQIIRDWIAAGCPLDTEVPKVASIELFPKNPVVNEIGSRQQIRIVATYTDGKKRDVSAEAFVDSGNQDVALHDDFGLLSTIRRGEAPILARYEGAYAATTVTVMGERDQFQWTEQPAHNEIDNLVAAKWQRMKILPSGMCTDEEFLRRVYLDLTGLPPSPQNIHAFLADKKPSRAKRDALVDSLIGSPDFVEHWANKWADKLMVNSKYLGSEGAVAYRDWIRKEVADNTPYDKFVHKILTASGSNKENPPASYYKILRTPEELMENTTHLFLATRFNCNKCHDHPFEKWNQNQYFETAAFFSQVGLKRDPASTKTIGGTAVEGAKPLFEIAYDLEEGDMIHERTGKVTAPKFPFEAEYKTTPEATRREELAAWITAPDNQYFAMSYANRIWGYLLGTGIIEPLDDIRAGNPPSNPELLNWLASEFINNDFNERHLMQLICKSRTYQLSIATNQWNEDDEINFSHAKARRLPAEVLFDTVYAATGSIPNIPGAKPGTRAAALSDVALDLKSGFLANLGRPPRVSACECERSNDVQLGAVMAMLSGPAVAEAIGDPENAITKLVARETNDQKMIEEIFLRVLNRAPKKPEVDAALTNMAQIEGDHDKLVASLAALEAKMIPITADKERDRLIAINKAKADIKAYTPEFNKKKAAAENAQKERIAVASKALKEYEAKPFASEFAKWEAELPLKALRTNWTPIDPGNLKANGNFSLEEQDDGSVLASGELNAVTDYTVTARTKLGTITGIMIEALPDDRLPGFGPGLNKNANFVVSEVALTYTPKPKAAAKGKPAPPAAKPVKAAFDDAYSDHIQKGFDVKNAINGKLDRGDKGWAVAGSTPGTPRLATFKLAVPIPAADMAVLAFTISNRYMGEQYTLGKFRLWVTDSEDPLNFGTPVAIAPILKLSPEERSAEQKAALEKYYRDHSEEFLKIRNKVAKEERPLPSDPAMDKLEAALAKAERPVPPDLKLEQLRADTKQSIAQSANRRLTAAQDLTWALINNPAFLFNH